MPRRWQITVAAFAVWFMLTNLVVIGFRLDDRGWNRMYPFSSMTFYSMVAARKPYDQHLSYPFAYGELIFNFADGSTKKWYCYPHINSDYNTALTNITDAKEKVKIQEGAIKSVLANVSRIQLISDCGSDFSVVGFTSIDYYASILEIPPYPDRAKFDVGQRALIARYETDGTGLSRRGPIFCGTARSKSPALGWTLTDMNCFSATIPGSTIGRGLICLCRDPGLERSFVSTNSLPKG